MAAPVYRRNQPVKGGVKKRAQRRLKALDGVSGVNAKDGLTGQEARRIKRAWVNQGRPGGGGTRPGGGAPAFGPKQKVTGKARQRAIKRYRALGREVPGLDQPFKKGLTGREARKIKHQWIKQGRPRPGGGGGNGRPRTGMPPDPYAQEVNALTQLQYGGQLRQLDYERRVAEQRAANQGGWYQNYQNTVAQAAAQNAAQTAALQQAQFNQANLLAGQDTQQNQQLLQQQQADAAMRGTTVDPSVAQNMQSAVAARQTQATSMGGLLAAQGQAQTGYLQGRVGTAAQEGIQAQRDELARKAKVDQLARDLQSDMGAFRVDTRRKLQETAHTQRLENKAYGLQETEALADIADDAADNAREDAKLRQKAKQDKAKNKLAKLKERNDRWKDRHQPQLDRLADLADDGKRNFSKTYSSGDTPAGGSKGSDKNGDGKPDKDPKYTPSQKNDKQEEFRRARAVSLRGIPRRDWISFVSEEYGIDPLVTRAALLPGTLTPRQRRELLRMGIKPKKPKRPGPHDLGATPSPLGPK